MKSLLLSTLLTFNITLFSQVAIISISPEDCSACADLPNFTFETLQDKFTGSTKVLMPSDFKELNDVFIRTYFGWDSTYASGIVFNDSTLYKKYNPGQRSHLTILDGNNEVIYNDLLARYAINPDSILDRVNQYLVDQSLEKVGTVRVVKVKKKISICKIVSGQGFAKGMTVIGKQ